MSRVRQLADRTTRRVRAGLVQVQSVRPLLLLDLIGAVMLIEPDSPALGDLSIKDGVTLRLHLRELLDPPMTDWLGQAHAEAARQIRGLVTALGSVAEVLEAAAEALGEFPADYDAVNPDSWAGDVADIDRLTVEYNERLRAALAAFDDAIAGGL